MRNCCQDDPNWLSLTQNRLNYMTKSANSTVQSVLAVWFEKPLLWWPQADEFEGFYMINCSRRNVPMSKIPWMLDLHTQNWQGCLCVLSMPEVYFHRRSGGKSLGRSFCRTWLPMPKPTTDEPSTFDFKKHQGPKNRTECQRKPGRVTNDQALWDLKTSLKRLHKSAHRASVEALLWLAAGETVTLHNVKIFHVKCTGGWHFDQWVPIQKHKE